MKLFKAEVTSVIDVFQTGSFQISSTSFSGNRGCIYTSPFGGLHEPISGQKAGFFAIPSVGQQILVTQTDDENNGDVFYFLAVIHSSDNRKDGDSIPAVAKAGPIPDEVYKSFPGAPQRLVFRDGYGNRLVLSHAYGKKVNREVNRAELIGSGGKRLALDESPMINRISLENEFKDGFYLTSNASPMSGMGERHMLFRTVGMMQHLSEFGISMDVTEGTELSLTNNSVGVNAAEGIPFGNVTLRSKYKDVNLTSEGSNGRVMVRSLGDSGVVQINSAGEVIIKAPNNSVYIEGNDINVKATNSLNLGAPSINIRGDNSVTITGGSTGTLSLTSAEATLDGTLVNLGPPTPPTAAQSPGSAPNYTNDYGD